MVEGERNWLLAKIGLIPEHDDDVMWDCQCPQPRDCAYSRDEQKWSSCSWLLLRHLAKMAPTVPEEGYLEEGAEYMPVSYADARRIMTRTDFLDPLDAFQVSREGVAVRRGLMNRSLLLT